MTPRFAIFRVGLFFLALSGFLCAHDPGLSTLRVEVRVNEISLVVALSPVDAAQLLPPERRQHDLGETQQALTELASGFYTLELDEAPLVLATKPETILVAGDNVEFQLGFKRPAGSRLTVKSRLFPALPPGHRQYATVVTSEGVLLAEKLLHLRESDLEVTLPPALAAGRVDVPPVATAVSSPPPTTPSAGSFEGFLTLGVEHILTGYDHLLFLFGVLVVCTRWRSMLAVVTSFTVGHSLTLIAATLDWVTISPRVIEPAIAASIVFVGVENLLRRGTEPTGRWLLTFLFGLIHGFGFAGVLRELGVGATPGGLLVPLFSFNLGVELGQLGVAAVVLPLLWWARRRPAFPQRVVPILSSLVALAGVYWLLERTVFS